MSDICKIFDDTRYSLKGIALLQPNQEITFTFSELLPAASPVSTVRGKKDRKEKDTEGKSIIYFYTLPRKKNPGTLKCP